MRRSSRLRGALAAGVAGSIAVIAGSPAATGCDTCDLARECAARNGVSEQSILEDGENRDLCGEEPGFLSLHSDEGVFLGKSASWVGDEDGVICSCEIVEGLVTECEIYSSE